MLVAVSPDGGTSCLCQAGEKVIDACLIVFQKPSYLSGNGQHGLGGLPACALLEIHQVISPGGIEAWLVQDHANPIVAMEFSFEGGSALDPEGKPGLANLVSVLLDEGAGPHDSEAFQQMLQDNAIRLSFDSGRDAFFGSLKTLREHDDLAYEMLRLALTEPRFDEAPVQRMKNAILAGIRRDLGDPGGDRTGVADPQDGLVGGVGRADARLHVHARAGVRDLVVREVLGVPAERRRDGLLFSDVQEACRGGVVADAGAQCVVEERVGANGPSGVCGQGHTGRGTAGD